jgi:hypothetical protein
MAVDPSLYSAPQQRIWHRCRGKIVRAYSAALCSLCIDGDENDFDALTALESAEARVKELEADRITCPRCGGEQRPTVWVCPRCYATTTRGVGYVPAEAKEESSQG